MVKIGVIGVGKLGTAILRGLINSGISPIDLFAYDLSPSSIERAEELGVNVCDSYSDVVTEAEVLIISVKPNDMTNVLSVLRELPLDGKFIVSTAAFIPLRYIEKWLDVKNVYRSMPNIAVEANAGFIALSPPSRRSALIEDIFSRLGDIEWVNERVLDLLTILSASTPAVVAELLDAFVLASLRAGVPLDVASRAASKVFIGVGKLAERKNLIDIRNSVITPGGTTIKLLENIHRYGVKNSLLLSITDTVDEFLDVLEEYTKEIEKRIPEMRKG